MILAEENTPDRSYGLPMKVLIANFCLCTIFSRSFLSWELRDYMWVFFYLPGKLVRSVMSLRSGAIAICGARGN